MTSDKQNIKTQKVWAVIAKRELSAYFTSPVAYIVSALFLLVTGFMFFSTFFLSGRAELRGFFGLLPVMFSLFIPALTMRVFSEEARVGSLETLLTLPVTIVDVVMGKYIASFISGMVMLFPTLSYVIVCFMFGTPDIGPIIGSYIGSLLLLAAFCAIGFFTSSCTKNQIIAFFASAFICVFLTLIDAFSVILPSSIVAFISFISAGSHFDSICRGIVDTRDVLYFVSLAAIFLVLTVNSINGSRKG